ncbi:urease accessory protein UreF [Melittangium boletus]|uniref:Urease accessory protein UreF n=1 Tax=Melittangium boletus DSM 14713 TaxID=1294270 RepID=A0A250IC87_9BACT|nr:urease accessory UreF family protein [Melittangium boletus]ATB28820.1 urease accessory protein UreF [Melittangium boletus DSM 14713]
MGSSWRVLQLADSGFPTGGFAHSGGLEAAVQHGEVRGREGLERFARELLWQVGHGALPALGAAHREPERLGTWDARMEAFLTQHVANRASRTQGRAFLDTCARIFPEPVGPVRQSAREAGLRYHHAPLFGAVLRVLEVELLEAQRLLLFQSLRGTLSAAVRMGIVGTHESHQIQHGCAPLLDEVLAACSGLGLEALAQTSPLLDLLGSTQDRLYSRLFLS